MAVYKNRFLRTSIFVLGFLSVGLGLIGVILPLLPTTPFILLAAWCFLKSSERTHTWIYTHPVLGKILQAWEKNRSISRPTKVLALIMIIISIISIVLSVDNIWVKGFVIGLLTAVSIFILTRNELVKD